MLRQKNIPWLGALIESVYVALPALTGFNFLLIAVTAFEPIKEFMVPIFPAFSFAWFVVTILVILACYVVLTYKYIVPSLWTFRNKQMHDFESKVLNEIALLRKEIKEAEVVATIGDDGEVKIKEAL